MRKRSLPVLIIPLFALCFWSCGAKVKAHRIAPAKFNIAGIRVLAVADFESDYSNWRMAGPSISDMVKDEIEESEFYSKVVRSPEMPLSPSNADLTRIERKYGASGVLTGAVRRARVDVHRDFRKEQTEVRTGRYKYETYWEGGQQKKRRVEIVEKETELIPVLRKRAELKVEVALVDVATGLHLDGGSYRESDSKSEEGYRIDSMISDSEMIRGLARKVSSRVAHDTAPHPVTEKIGLESGGGCKDGVKLAQKGEGDAAVDSWKSLVDSDPDNHAALYNLGVAAEVAKDYAVAERYYMGALDIKDKGRYRKALQRAGRLVREKERLEGQMEGKK
jgi:tetratricopeptide (TPR) repeat protein